MCLQSKTMSLVYISFNLLLLFVCCSSVNGFRYNKPIIYLNLFDDLKKDSVNSTKNVEEGISTAKTPSNNTATTIHHTTAIANATTHSNATAKAIKKRLDFFAELPKLNDENKTSSASYDEMFEFDMPSKADITEDSVNESDSRIHTPTAGFADPMEYEFLEPELTRLFFMKAIANIIENIIATLFAAEEPLKPGKIEPAIVSDLDHNPAPSRNMIKRAVLTDETTKLDKEINSTSSSGASFKTDTSNISEMKNTNPSLSTQMNGNSTEKVTEVTYSELVSDHTSLPHSSDKAEGNQSHGIRRESEAHQTVVSVKDENKLDDLPNGKVLQPGKSIGYLNSGVKPISGDEDRPISISLLNDEIENQKDTNLYKGIHLVKRHDGVAENSEHEKNSRGIVTGLIVGTTALTFMLLGALVLAAGYLYRKRQDPENQIATNLQSAVA